jgi:hypothetical protein
LPGTITVSGRFYFCLPEVFVAGNVKLQGNDLAGFAVCILETAAAQGATISAERI